MTLNLTNPITEDLTVNMLSGDEDNQCYISRTGYEVLVQDEKYALYPQFSEETAKIGEIVSISSMGRAPLGQVVKVLTGYEEGYTEQTIIGETDTTYKVQEKVFSRDRGINEKTFELEKEKLDQNTTD